MLYGTQLKTAAKIQSFVPVNDLSGEKMNDSKSTVTSTQKLNYE